MAKRKYHYEEKLVPKKNSSIEQLWLWGISAVCGFLGAFVAMAERAEPHQVFFLLFMGLMGTANFVVRSEIRKVRVYDESEEKENKLDLPPPGEL